VLHGRAPSYLGPLVRVADVSGRRALRSAGTNRILMPPVMSTTVGSPAFPVAASLIWNSQPDDVISAESLPTFQRKLKRHLCCQSFPGFCYWHLHLQWILQWQCHSKNTLIDWLINKKNFVLYGQHRHFMTKFWYTRRWMASLHNIWRMIASLPADDDCNCLRFRDSLTQVWAIAHSLLLDCVYISIYVSLNILSCSSTSYWRRTSFDENSGVCYCCFLSAL